MAERTRSKLWVMAILLVGVVPVRAEAQPFEHQLIDMDAAATNVWPAADGLIGTMDDVVDANPSPFNSSEPNLVASYSYNAFDFDGSGTITDSPKLPTGTQGITFLQGTVTVDTAVAAAGGGPLITDWDLSGTQPYTTPIPHGAYTTQITAVNGGSYDPATKAYTLDVDFDANLASFGTGSVSNMMLSGDAYYLEASSGFAPTGNAYVDNVLIPLAQSRNATTLLFAQGSGVVPMSTAGTAPLPNGSVIQAVLVAITVPEAGAGSLAAGAILTLGTLLRRRARPRG